MTPEEPIFDPVDTLESIIDPVEEFQYAPMSLSRAPANVKFAYLHIGKDFVEKSTDTSYRIHDIVRVTSSSSLSTLCLQFFDILLRLLILNFLSMNLYICLLTRIILLVQ